MLADVGTAVRGRSSTTEVSTMRRTLLGALMGALFFTAAAPAEAQWVPKSMGNRLGGEFDYWGTDFSDVLTWGFVGQIELTDTVYLDVELPWTYASYEFGFGGRGEDAFFLGNPTVGVHYADKVHRKVGFFAGGTLSVSPLINPDGETVLGAYLASAERAYFDMYRTFPEFMFIRPRVGVEVQIIQPLYFRADLAPVIWIPIGDDFDEVQFVVDQGNEIEARADVGVGGGLRVQQVIIATDLLSSTGRRDDRVQLAMEPYFVYEPDEGFFARLGLLVALDEPGGFGFDRGKVATLRVAMGGKWGP
jgi:hypothetical protein